MHPTSAGLKKKGETSSRNCLEKNAGSSNNDLESIIVCEENTSVITTQANSVPVTSCSSRIISKTQTVLSDYLHKPISNKKSQELNFSLVNVLVKNYLPMQLVDSVHFRNFVHSLNSNYSVPSRKTVATVLIPQLYDIAAEKIKTSLRSPDINAVCLTTDSWTSRANENYVAITVHYIHDFKLKSHILDCYCYSDSHTALNLCSEIKKIAEKWGIQNKIVAIVSDNAANVKAAVKLTGYKQISCFAHTLNLIVEQGLKKIKDVQTSVKGIIEFFKRSPQASEKLRQMQVQLNLPQLHVKQDVKTRWNSTFDMFTRVIEIKDSLIATIALHYPKAQLTNLTNDDINLLTKCCEILRVFKDVTEEMSSEKFITVSKIILLSNALKNWCTNLTTQNFRKMRKL